MNADAYLHENEVPGSTRAAERIVPLILETLGHIRSVVDLGGGTGAWLRVFQTHAVENIFLIDRPELESHLLIDRASFRPADLSTDFPTVPRVDLAVSVECAEHLSSRRA